MVSGDEDGTAYDLVLDERQKPGNQSIVLYLRTYIFMKPRRFFVLVTSSKHQNTFVVFAWFMPAIHEGPEGESRFRRVPWEASVI